MRLLRPAALVAAGAVAGWLAHHQHVLRLRRGDGLLHYGGFEDEAACGRVNGTTTVFSAIVTCPACQEKVDEMLEAADRKHSCAR